MCFFPTILHMIQHLYENIHEQLKLTSMVLNKDNLT